MTRLLVIRFSALGDVALLVPVVRTLATRYNDLHITLLSQQRFAPLWENLPDNVTFVGADLRGRHRGLRGLLRLAQELQITHFDAVADMHSVLRSRVLTLYIRLATLFRRTPRIAAVRKGRLAKRLLVWHLLRRPLPAATDRYAAVLCRLGIPVTLQPEPLHTDGHGIGFAPFAAHAPKIYPHAEALLEALNRRGEPVLLFGSRDEAPLLEQWVQRFTNVVSVAGRLSMREELDTMRGLRAVIAMDSANMHLASLAGTRVISLWGPTHPHAGFLGYGQSLTDCVQLDLPCRPCSVYGRRPCRKGDHRCMACITPEQILRTLDRNNTFVPDTLIHRGRNILTRGTYGDIPAVCKQYARPSWPQAFIYRYLRTPKAERAYRNALRLRTLGIDTPEPLAFGVTYHAWGIGDSYYLSALCPYPHTAYEWGSATPENAQATIRAFARWAAALHTQGVLHLDFSPGNILWTADGGEYRFALVDINRLRFGPVSVEAGLRNMARLWLPQPLLRMLADNYADARHADKDTCWHILQQAHRTFWKRRRRAKQLGDHITHHNIDGTMWTYRFDFN